MIIIASSEEEAVSHASGKVKAMRHVLKVVGGDAVQIDGGPAPVDWAKESAKIAELRGKAMQFMAMAVDKHDSIKLLNPIFQADGSSMAWGDDANAFLCLDTDGLFLHEQDYPEKDHMLVYFEDSIVIEIAMEVQKALAEGHQTLV